MIKIIVLYLNILYHLMVAIMLSPLSPLLTIRTLAPLGSSVLKQQQERVASGLIWWIDFLALHCGTEGKVLHWTEVLKEKYCTDLLKEKYCTNWGVGRKVFNWTEVLKEKYCTELTYWRRSIALNWGAERKVFHWTKVLQIVRARDNVDKKEAWLSVVQSTESVLFTLRLQLGKPAKYMLHFNYDMPPVKFYMKYKTSNISYKTIKNVYFK